MALPTERNIAAAFSTTNNDRPPWSHDGMDRIVANIANIHATFWDGWDNVAENINNEFYEDPMNEIGSCVAGLIGPDTWSGKANERDLLNAINGGVIVDH